MDEASAQKRVGLRDRLVQRPWYRAYVEPLRAYGGYVSSQAKRVFINGSAEGPRPALGALTPGNHAQRQRVEGHDSRLKVDGGHSRSSGLSTHHSGGAGKGSDSAARSLDVIHRVTVDLRTNLQDGTDNLGWSIPQFNRLLNVSQDKRHAIGICNRTHVVEYTYKKNVNATFLVFNVYRNASHLRREGSHTLFLSMEPPTHHDMNALKGLHGFFDGRIGFDREATLWSPYLRRADMVAGLTSSIPMLSTSQTASRFYRSHLNQVAAARKWNQWPKTEILKRNDIGIWVCKHAIEPSY